MCTFEEFYSAREKASLFVFVELALDEQSYLKPQATNMVSILVSVEPAFEE